MTEEDFARAGSLATKQVIVDNTMLYNHPVSMVEQFRKLGVPVEVQNGRILLVGKKEHIVCKEGDILSAEACKLLVHFGVKLASFRVQLICHWRSDDGALEFYNL
jgi:mRNA turnover protein 4